MMSCSPAQVFFRCLNIGSTLSAPWAYLQKHGWPWIGIPASFEILRSWSVKPLQARLNDSKITEQHASKNISSSRPKKQLTSTPVMFKVMRFSSLDIRLRKQPYLRISSRHCLCVAKQAMAHIFISTPVWNCFPLMSQTPWLGVATVRF